MGRAQYSLETLERYSPVLGHRGSTPLRTANEGTRLRRRIEARLSRWDVRDSDDDDDDDDDDDSDDDDDDDDDHHPPKSSTKQPKPSRTPSLSPPPLPSPPPPLSTGPTLTNPPVAARPEAASPPPAFAPPPSMPPPTLPIATSRAPKSTSSFTPTPLSAPLLSQSARDTSSTTTTSFPSQSSADSSPGLITIASITDTETRPSFVPSPSPSPPEGTEATGVQPSSGSSKPRNLTVILSATIAGTLILAIFLRLICFHVWRRRRRQKRHNENWAWFDRWRRRHKSLSIITDVEVQGLSENLHGPEKTLLNEQNVEKHTISASRLSTDSPTLHHSILSNKTSTLHPNSVVSDGKKKFRVVSMGDLTNHTGTTSNTNLVVALPPPTHDGQFIRRDEHHPHGFYDPASPKRLTPRPYAAEDILTTAGIQNARLLF